MLEAHRLWALLWRQTEGKISKDQFMSLTDYDLVNVLYRPGVHDNAPPERHLPYWPVPVGGKDEEGAKSLTFQEMYVAHWTQYGLTEAEALAKFEVWFRGYDGPAFTPEEPAAG